MAITVERCYITLGMVCKILGEFKNDICNTELYHSNTLLKEN